jgi:N-acetylmuramoyl-L-alanine amidase
MKRHVTIASLFACAALTASSLMAANPFGAIQGLQGGYNGGSGNIPLIGWALDDDGVARVDIVIDNIIVGSAEYGGGRPRITKRYPGFIDSAAPGWVFWINTTHYLNGNHKVGAIIRSRTGESTALAPITLLFNNDSHADIPFGQIEFPNPQAELWGYCNSNTQHWSIITGYALDSGVEVNDEGVGYVELLIDHALWANDKLDCTYWPPAGGRLNCYGIRREDIAARFPSIKDSIHSGFRMGIDVGALIRSQLYARGDHWLTIRVGDVLNQQAEIDEIKVTFNCIEDSPNLDSFGFIENPLPGYSYHGTIPVTGWALDPDGVFQVEISVDGAVQGLATYHLPRTDVASWYPGYPDDPNAGFSFSLDTTPLSNGEHQIQELVIDNTGAITLTGQRLIYVNNP